MPSNRTYNWNQFYTGVTKAIGSTAGCKFCCGLDVANIYGPNSYTPSDLSFAWGNTGYTWALLSGCSVSFKSSYDTPTDYYKTIRSEINNNRAVVVLLSGSETVTHTVVAYGYTGEGNSDSEIKVLDPARSTTDTTTMTGRDTTLDEAMTFNSKNAINGLRLITIATTTK